MLTNLYGLFMNQTKEKDTLRACLSYLEYSPKGKFWRNNTGATISEHRGKKRFIRYGRVGSADITGILKDTGKRIEIEIKAPTGKQTEAQKEFQREIEACGGVYLLAKSVDDLIAWGL